MAERNVPHIQWLNAVGVFALTSTSNGPFKLPKCSWTDSHWVLRGMVGMLVLPEVWLNRLQSQKLPHCKEVYQVIQSDQTSSPIVWRSPFQPSKDHLTILQRSPRNASYIVAWWFQIFWNWNPWKVEGNWIRDGSVPKKSPFKLWTSFFLVKTHVYCQQTIKRWSTTCDAIPFGRGETLFF